MRLENTLERKEIGLENILFSIRGVENILERKKIGLESTLSDG
jgi:hypothetical protein